ncbi:hypothetical protein GJ496_010601 [Pomphorhynchus laevis]|nr:hypothetical protein GJ496_010601 [Pomphorhynchus laevis]
MKVKLESNDGDVFEVDMNVACQSTVVKTMLEDLNIGQDEDEPVSLPNVNGVILRKIVQWCTYHKDDVPLPEDEDVLDRRLDDLCIWDKEFLKVDQGTLLELIMAANYLDIRSLLEASCKTVAAMMRGKTAEELRRLFNIQNDFTPAEEEQIRQENEWCDETSEHM